MATRFAEYCQRLRFVLGRSKRRAIAVMGEDFRNSTPSMLSNLDGCPMVGAWWYFLRRLDVDQAINFYDAAVLEKVKFVLGKKLSCYELLLLPQNWKGNTFWDGFVDVLTGNSINNIIPHLSTGTEKQRKKGIAKRLENYLSIEVGVRKHENTAHTKLLVQPDTLGLGLFIYGTVPLLDCCRLR